MNTFLEMMEITFRRDPYNFRPRINKHSSVKDTAQKKAGKFFLMDEGEATRTEVAAEGDDEEEKTEAPARQAPA